MAANKAKGGSNVTNQKDAGNYDPEAHQTAKQYTDATPEQRAEVDRRVREQQELKQKNQKNPTETPPKQPQ
jgi:hypothetical protein